VTLTMDSDKSITAHFVEIPPNQFTLTLASDPPEGGTIIATPSGGTYDAGTIVTLTAVPNNGYSFKEWTGTGITASATTPTIQGMDWNRHNSIGNHAHHHSHHEL